MEFGSAGPTNPDVLLPPGLLQIYLQPIENLITRLRRGRIDANPAAGAAAWVGFVLPAMHTQSCLEILPGNPGMVWIGKFKFSYSHPVPPAGSPLHQASLLTLTLDVSRDRNISSQTSLGNL